LPWVTAPAAKRGSRWEWPWWEGCCSLYLTPVVYTYLAALTSHAGKQKGAFVPVVAEPGEVHTAR